MARVLSAVTVATAGFIALVQVQARFAPNVKITRMTSSVIIAGHVSNAVAVRKISSIYLMHMTKPFMAMKCGKNVHVMNLLIHSRPIQSRDRCILICQLSDQGPVYAVNHNILPQPANQGRLYDEGATQDCPDGDLPDDGGGERSFIQDIQESQKGCGIPYGEKRKKGSIFTQFLSSISETAKANWVSDVNSCMSDPYIIDKYTEELVLYNQRLRDLAENYRKVWCTKVATTKFTLSHIFNELEELTSPTFGIPSDNLMSVDDTVVMLKAIFKANHNILWEEVLDWTCKWFDGKCGKRNTLVIVGPASVGKTWLADLFSKLALFTGRILNYDRNSSFVFENTVNCRLIIHDEAVLPLEAPEYFGTIKKIYGGQSAEVNVKYGKGKHNSSPVPVLMLTNHHPLRNLPSGEYGPLLDRMTIWQFSTPIPEMNLPIDIKHGNPLGFMKLVKYIRSK